mmetsp:Transcript_74899/g.194780  ORF Transcript_74899/g.194780 Transcript_74899/m.194780 type:complete len:208 (-) Transcript_74899:194-817(-)
MGAGLMSTTRRLAAATWNRARLSLLLLLRIRRTRGSGLRTMSRRSLSCPRATNARGRAVRERSNSSSLPSSRRSRCSRCSNLLSWRMVGVRLWEMLGHMAGRMAGETAAKGTTGGTSSPRTRPTWVSWAATTRRTEVTPWDRFKATTSGSSSSSNSSSMAGPKRHRVWGRRWPRRRRDSGWARRLGTSRPPGHRCQATPPSTAASTR